MALICIAIWMHLCTTVCIQSLRGGCTALTRWDVVGFWICKYGRIPSAGSVADCRRDLRVLAALRTPALTISEIRNRRWE